MKTLFHDRRYAGRALADKLVSQDESLTDPLVLALPRGGVPLAFEVASRFRAPLDICVVQVLKMPDSDGVVVGAIVSYRVLFLRWAALRAFDVSDKDLQRLIAKHARDLRRREQAYRAGCAAVPVAGRSVVLVDDGLTSADTLFAAVAAIRACMPERLLVALPIAGASYAQLLAVVDDVVCLDIQSPLPDVASWYGDRAEVSDLDVRRLYAQARAQFLGAPFAN